MSWLIILPIIAAIASGGGLVIEKVVLKTRKVGPRLYQTAGFLAIILIMIPFIFFFWKLDPAALSLTNILIMLAVVAGSVIANVFVFYSLKWEKVSHIEPARLLEPLFVILLAIGFSYLFGETLFERNTAVIIPAIIASLALVASHIKKHHLEFNKYFIAAILGSLFFALELVVSRLILDFYSPMSFYFIRSFLVLLVSYLIFRPNFNRLPKKARWEILAAGAIWIVFRVLMYYGYIELGVIFTTLMLMLGPIFIYLFAWKFLGEKPGWRNLGAAVVIIAAVLYAVLA